MTEADRSHIAGLITQALNNLPVTFDPVTVDESTEPEPLYNRFIAARAELNDAIAFVEQML